MCFMYQCLLNKCGFSYCQSWTCDIQNPRSVGLKKNSVYFHEQITPLGIEKEKKKNKPTTQSSSEQERNNFSCLSEERRKILLPAALPGTDVAQQTPTCHGQYRRFLENSSSPTHCHVTLRPKEHMSLKWLFQNRISHSFVSKSSLKAKTQILLIFCLKAGLGRFLSSDFCFILGFFGQSLPGIKKKDGQIPWERRGSVLLVFFSPTLPG